MHKRAVKLDGVLAGAVDVARASLEPIAKPAEIGPHVEVQMEGERLATHYFECLKPGYRGWRWAAVVARVPRGRSVTICEVALVPGADALLAPQWVPWAQRIKPEDLKQGDVLPYVEDDERLDPGFGHVSDDADEQLIEEVGLGRPRVLSARGRDQAVARWYEQRGGASQERSRARQDATCANCGFLMKMAGSVRTLFGVCANEWSAYDGQVVALNFSCGAHSETDIEKRESRWPARKPHLSDVDLEVYASAAEAEPGSETDTESDAEPEGAAEATAEAKAETKPEAAAEEAGAAQDEESAAVAAEEAAAELANEATEAPRDEQSAQTAAETSATPAQSAQPSADEETPAAS